MNDDALFIISTCEDWYKNRPVDKFHTRQNLNDIETKMKRLNFAKRCCADDANLCEIISVTPENSENSKEFIEDLLKKNQFDTMYRQQLEKTCATGTVGGYIYLKGADYFELNGVVSAKNGQIKINYVDADCIIPLTIENGEITECGFSVTNRVKGKKQTTLVIFTLESNNRYKAETVIFDQYGTKTDKTEITLGEVKPFFIMRNAEVNNLDNMDGYGLPKIYNTIPFFMALDLSYNILFGDLDKGEKMIFINELLACIQRDPDTNKAVLTPKQKELFVLLGEKLPNQSDLIYEYNPEIRVGQITQIFELILSLISMSFGYGTKKYTFENGQITTATQYIGEKQDEIQELNKQRKQSTQYIEDLVHAAMWFSNQFQGTNYDLEENLIIEFDDSYIEDKTTALEILRADAITFENIDILKVRYFKERYHLTDEEAQEWVDSGKMVAEPAEDFE